MGWTVQTGRTTLKMDFNAYNFLSFLSIKLDYSFNNIVFIFFNTFIIYNIIINGVTEYVFGG